MTLKVYGIYGSPPFGAVLMCAKVLGIQVDIVVVDLINKAHMREEFLKIDPQHTVPYLDDNGFILIDSHAINGYLVGTYGKENDPLYPKDDINDIKKRAIIDHRLHLDSSIVGARSIAISLSIIFREEPPSQQALDDLRDAYVILDKQIEVQKTKYIAGNVLTIADFSITATVTSWGYFVKNWENEFPNIKAYIDRMKKENFFEANVKGIDAFVQIMEKKLGLTKE